MLPTMLDTALSEYQKYIDKGGKGSLEDFIISSGNVLGSGVEAAPEGAIFAMLGRYMEPLKKIPKFKKLFEMKRGGPALEKAAEGAI